MIENVIHCLAWNRMFACCNLCNRTVELLSSLWYSMFLSRVLLGARMLLGVLAMLLGAISLLRMLLGAPGHTTRSKDATTKVPPQPHPSPQSHRRPHVKSITASLPKYATPRDTPRRHPESTLQQRQITPQAVPPTFSRANAITPKSKYLGHNKTLHVLRYFFLNTRSLVSQG